MQPQAGGEIAVAYAGVKQSHQKPGKVDVSQFVTSGPVRTRQFRATSLFKCAFCTLGSLCVGIGSRFRLVSADGSEMG